jgi:uncharacterized protein YyaL (SSP411 family)
MQPWQGVAGHQYHPHRLVLAIPGDVTDLPGILAERTSRNGVTAYICTGHTCSAPVMDLAQFESSLKLKSDA